MAAGNILIVDDDEDILTAGKLLLKRHFDRVVTCNRPEHIPDLLADRTFDAILLDMNFGPGESTGRQGLAWLDRIMTIDPRAVVVLITAHGGVDMAVEAMKRGATDFITKPWQNEKVVATLSAGVKLGQSRSEADTLKKANKVLARTPEQPIIFDNPAMAGVMDMVERAAPTDAGVLLLGENGTGKELVARAIHARSLRAGSVFMNVDLGALSESLFESELFGHKKGAFTDAREDRTGLIEAASGGTLFLDEVGNLAPHLQAKLLTVLEQRQITPVGATRAVRVDVRVIAATNLPRERLADETVFRQDLLFRLNTVEIDLPPLRDRAGDIPLLSRHYAGFFARKYQRPAVTVSAAALDVLSAYAWPGNVRELRHAIERAVILSSGDVLRPQDFALSSPSVTPKLTPAGAPAAPGGDMDSAADGTGQDGAGLPADLNLGRLEKTAIATALRKHRYNISHAAKDLGVTRAALYRRMEKYGL
ncbi:sigma-54-dependent transcriptional regulator [Eilatimonas milleporae]|uniref:DNA-binding NtrC family response regulator n=1 Tax=Eilatimonas milleporae TaxID=911205 RepID=A0A3M0CFQ5_9PROT|nr:sigma-54 dependent transcriptional regulator [Eilatimonas milleporae]RMB07647.1 DNA-binding NtrC family response regulator [Eilatimonas milleporae]